MARDVEAKLAMLLIPVAGFCLWYFSHVTAAITSSIAITIATDLYLHSQHELT